MVVSGCQGDVEVLLADRNLVLLRLPKDCMHYSPDLCSTQVDLLAVVAVSWVTVAVA